MSGAFEKPQPERGPVARSLPAQIHNALRDAAQAGAVRFRGCRNCSTVSEDLTQRKCPKCGEHRPVYVGRPDPAPPANDGAAEASAQ